MTIPMARIRASGPDSPKTEGMNKTLIVQGAILGGIIVLLVLASIFDLI
jgi:hypothetical protein